MTVILKKIMDTVYVSILSYTHFRKYFTKCDKLRIGSIYTHRYSQNTTTFVLGLCRYSMQIDPTLSVPVAGPNVNIISKQDPITKVCGDRPN